MNKGTRLVAGAAAACVLATPTAALADAAPNPTAVPPGFNPGDPVTSLPLPDGVAQCLMRSGLPIPSSGTDVALPTPAGAPPISFSGTLPLPAAGTPTGTSPAPAAGTIPLPVVGGGTDGSLPVPGGNAAGSGALQCGQMIVNNTVYWVIVTPTTTTTTTTANGPIAAGPVAVTAPPAPAAAPVSTPAPATAPATKHRSRRYRSGVRKHRVTHKTRALHVALVKRPRH